MDSEASRVILPAVAYVLNEIVNRNNDLAVRYSHLCGSDVSLQTSFTKADATIFHGLKPPSITIRAYLERYVQRTQISPPILTSH